MFDLEKYLTELRDAQMKKLEALNEHSTNGGAANSDTNSKNSDSTCVTSSFKFPISYVDNKQEINENIINDLELVVSKNPDEPSMYSHIFKPESIFSKKFLNEWSKYYTTDVAFLKDSQLFYKAYVSLYEGDLKAKVTMTTDTNEVTIDPHDIFEKIDKLWIDIAGDKNFKQRFNYIDIPILDRLNKSPGFLQILSVYNLTSPVISLLSPLILLIIPFFLLKLQKVNITVTGYIETLKKIFATHPLGKMFSLLDFSSLCYSGLSKYNVMLSVLQKYDFNSQEYFYPSRLFQIHFS